MEREGLGVFEVLVLVLAVTYVIVNLLVDVSYAWLNPEIRLGEGQ